MEPPDGAVSMPYRNNRSNQFSLISVSIQLNALEVHAGIMGNPHDPPASHRDSTGFEEQLSVTRVIASQML